MLAGPVSQSSSVQFLKNVESHRSRYRLFKKMNKLFLEMTRFYTGSYLGLW